MDNPKLILSMFNSTLGDTEHATNEKMAKGVLASLNESEIEHFSELFEQAYSYPFLKEEYQAVLKEVDEQNKKDKEDAEEYIAGYCVINDVSEREFQLKKEGQWTKGKSCDTFGPTGPYLVTKDEITDVQNLKMYLDVNGKRMQDGSTKTMIFSAKHIVYYLSQFMSLNPGDVIATGTPPGVGGGMKPPVFLKAGDKMKLGIEGLGEQNQTCFQG